MDSPSIKQYVEQSHDGKLLLSPFAEVTIFLADELVSATDPEKQMIAFQKAITSRDSKSRIKLSTANLISPGMSSNNVGVIDNLTVELHHLYGGSFSLRILDVEGGIQVNKFIEQVTSNGTPTISSYCQIKFGWIASGKQNLNSDLINFMITDITAEFQAGNFYYILTGAVIAAPYFLTSYMIGSFKGTIKQALDEWERITGIKVKNRKVINEQEELDFTDKHLFVDKNSPMQVLSRILQSASPSNKDKNQKTKKAPNRNVGFNVHYELKEVYIKVYSNIVYDIFDSYTIGEHNSLVVDFTAKNNLNMSKITEHYVHSQFDIETNKYSFVGEDTRKDKGKFSSQISPIVRTNVGNQAQNSMNPTILDDYNVRKGSMTIIGDPDLIPSSNPGKKGFKFYNLRSPFLGIKINVKQPKLMNLIAIDSTEPISNSHWLNAIYLVGTVTHSIDSNQYTTTMELQADINAKTLFNGTI